MHVMYVEGSPSVSYVMGALLRALMHTLLLRLVLQQADAA
jgi:hypothetical protein